ncbi:hypothetical protein [Edaphobacter sp. 12200R-103]|jgi:hypothetical protein|uniref:hypothetical protein n=1 Tax=Edaphobacter sp. 12200R-103 TaxID=2703788 RepID=UPI00138C467B|nr:hypothetical protein [Edaphobacter sp. 12200R-103]QHS53221.1 hypothetical protein GWR55_17005 [Edaphobacter sp. 12200R-103]
MKHISEEQLIDYYYGEAESPAAISRHLETCSECAQSYESLVHDLKDLKPYAVPPRDGAYGEEVWRSIRGSVSAYEPTKKRSLRGWFGLHWSFAAATACLLLAAAFFAGRQWEHRNGTAPVNVANQEQGRQRVVLLVLGDHLDRSERLLVELKHAEPSTEAPLQAEARDLLSANRLYRESIRQQGDPALASALDHLERVLIEVSNEPAGLSQAKLDELQKEMNTDGLLFEVRVLRSRVQEDVNRKGSTAVAGKGVSIL